MSQKLADTNQQLTKSANSSEQNRPGQLNRPFQSEHL